MSNESNLPPLFVDLDGTLIKTDLLAESALALIKQSPWMIFSMLVWLLGGKARFKAEIARRTTLDIATLPLQLQLVEHLKGEASRGRDIYLATASDRLLAEPVGQRVGLFKGVLASDGERNLRGSAKLKAILEMTGGGPFDYVGNSRVDFPIWKQARRALVVNPGLGVAAGARARTELERVFDDRAPVWRVWLKEARVYQWLKNLLLGVPLFTSHAFDMRSAQIALTGFVAFGLLASATYLLNDLLDLSSDRAHPRKRRRPFAAGDLSLVSGVVALIVLLYAGLKLAASISPLFHMILLLYLSMTLSYSLVFKTHVIVDVILLAFLYTIRIIAGAAAIGVDVSSWLLAFSMFTFLSLALVKRSSELVDMASMDRASVKGRDYQLVDAPSVTSMGVAAGYMAVLVLALYVDNPHAAMPYTHQRLLWLLCPLMLYWISRLWMKTGRGEMHDDPLIFSLRDPASWAVCVSMMVVTLLAI